MQDTRYWSGGANPSLPCGIMAEVLLADWILFHKDLSLSTRDDQVGEELSKREASLCEGETGGAVGEVALSLHGSGGRSLVMEAGQ